MSYLFVGGRVNEVLWGQRWWLEEVGGGFLQGVGVEAEEAVRVFVPEGFAFDAHPRVPRPREGRRVLLALEQIPGADALFFVHPQPFSFLERVEALVFISLGVRARINGLAAHQVAHWLAQGQQLPRLGDGTRVTVAQLLSSHRNFIRN